MEIYLAGANAPWRSGSFGSPDWRGFDQHGFSVMCLWGMTETSPHATCSQLRPFMNDWSDDKHMRTA